MERGDDMIAVRPFNFSQKFFSENPLEHSREYYVEPVL